MNINLGDMLLPYIHNLEDFFYNNFRKVVYEAMIYWPINKIIDFSYLTDYQNNRENLVFETRLIL